MSVRQAILDEAKADKLRLKALLFQSSLDVDDRDVEQVIQVLDVLLNVPRERVEEMMNLSRRIAGARRALPQWS